MLAILFNIGPENSAFSIQDHEAGGALAILGNRPVWQHMAAPRVFVACTSDVAYYCRKVNAGEARLPRDLDNEGRAGMAWQGMAEHGQRPWCWC
jgi:hypothetical protein